MKEMLIILLVISGVILVGAIIYAVCQYGEAVHREHRKEVCEWSHLPEKSTLKSGCEHYILSLRPVENWGFSYCPFCGKKIK